MPWLPLKTHVNGEVLEDLYTDYPFNWTLNLAIYHLGDAGVIADIHWYRSSFLKLKYIWQENTHISHILEYLQKEQEQYNTKLVAFVKEVKGIREWLTKGRVMSCIIPAYCQMAIEGRIPNAYYLQVFEEMVQLPQRPSTLRPTLRPTNPEPPSKASNSYFP